MDAQQRDRATEPPAGVASIPMPAWSRHLMNADLRHAHLSGANLVEADLIAAKLQGATLSGANLLETDLLGADLTGAKYAAEDLRGALHVPVDSRNTIA